MIGKMFFAKHIVCFLEEKAKLKENIKTWNTLRKSIKTREEHKELR